MLTASDHPTATPTQIPFAPCRHLRPEHFLLRHDLGLRNLARHLVPVPGRNVLGRVDHPGVGIVGPVLGRNGRFLILLVLCDRLGLFCLLLGFGGHGDERGFLGVGQVLDYGQLLGVLD